MDNRTKTWAYLGIALILALAGLLYLVSRPSLNFSLEISGPGPGWVDITLNSNMQIQTAVLTMTREAKLTSCNGTKCTFKYWISPKDQVGTYNAKIQAKIGGSWTEATLPINITKNTTWKEIAGIVLYTYGNETLNLKPFTTKELNLVLESQPGKTKGNAEIIKAEVPIVAGLSVLNRTIHVYGLVREEEKCIYSIVSPGANTTNTTNVSKRPYKDCINEIKSKPTIFIHPPDYPTTQVLVTGQTLHLQPSPGKSQDLGYNLALILARQIKGQSF